MVIYHRTPPSPSCLIDTPLGIASGRGGKPELILLLVRGGAHLYFRGKDGLTPMHRAAIGGNTEAIKTLLGLGASPNYRDAKVGCSMRHSTTMQAGLTWLREWAHNECWISMHTRLWPIKSICFLH